MLASLSGLMAWKPNASSVKKTKHGRAPTATSEMGDSSDDVSETESAESSQCGAPFMRRQQSCPVVGQCKTRIDAQPECENDAEAGRPALKSVYSFARAGLTSSSKLFQPKTRLAPKNSKATSSKSRSCSADMSPRQDMSTKLAGDRIATCFGLGKIVAIREEDGVAAIDLQASGLLYLSAVEMSNAYVIPALIGEHVHTPSGSGRVLKYDGREKLYTLQLGADGGLDEYELQLRPSDVRRVDSRKPGRALEPRRSRGMSDDSHMDRDSRQARPRLSSASSATGLTMLKNIAATFVASKYHQGQPVITKFGAGYIVSLNLQRDSAQIQLLWGAVAFLNADMIDYYPKALEGTEVHTKFGSGVVIGLRPADAIYTVRLHDLQPAGISNVVFVHESDLHRSLRIVVTAANVRDKLKAMAQRHFGERIVVAHQSHDEEPNSAGI